MNECYLREAKAILEGKHWQGKNRCVKLPGDPGYVPPPLKYIITATGSDLYACWQLFNNNFNPVSKHKKPKKTWWNCTPEEWAKHKENVARHKARKNRR
jgi:hypothetical protein